MKRFYSLCLCPSIQINIHSVAFQIYTKRDEGAWWDSSWPGCNITNTPCMDSNNIQPSHRATQWATCCLTGRHCCLWAAAWCFVCGYNAPWIKVTSEALYCAGKQKTAPIYQEWAFASSSELSQHLGPVHSRAGYVTHCCFSPGILLLFLFLCFLTASGSNRSSCLTGWCNQPKTDSLYRLSYSKCTRRDRGSILKETLGSVHIIQQAFNI